MVLEDIRGSVSGVKERFMEASLVLVQADGKQRDVALKKAVQLIGRQTDCQIRIPSASVSRHHCEIIVSDSSVQVRDLGSSNGTYVNKQRVNQTDLNAGDLISVGGLVFVVRIDGKPVFIESDDVIEDGLVPIASAPAAESRPTAATVVDSDKPASKPSKAPQKKAPSPGDSSVTDFDFLDDDDDALRGQPKL